MSALPPKADIRPGAQNVRLVPKADIVHFVWANWEGSKYVQEMSSLGCFDIRVQRRTSTCQIAVPVDVVDAIDRRPILIDPKCSRRETRRVARVRAVPLADEILNRMWRVLQGVILRVYATLLNGRWLHG